MLQEIPEAHKKRMLEIIQENKKKKKIKSAKKKGTRGGCSI